MTMSEQVKAPNQRFYGIVPEMQQITSIEAKPGTVSAIVLQKMSEEKETEDYTLFFPKWMNHPNGTKVSEGIIRVYKHAGDYVDLPLKLVLTEIPAASNNTLVLADVSRVGKLFSINETSIGSSTIEVNSRIAQLQQAEHYSTIRHIATTIVTSWVIRGRDWIDNQRKLIQNRIDGKAARRPFKVYKRKRRDHLYGDDHSYPLL